jgi:hypothetical protein
LTGTGRRLPPSLQSTANPDAGACRAEIETTMLRQLDQRNSAGIRITLEWDSDADRVFVRCEDEHAGDQPLLSYPVAPHDARFAFLHPFAANPSVDSHAPTSDSDDVASFDGTHATKPIDGRRRRWYHLLGAEFEYVTWWPV